MIIAVETGFLLNLAEADTTAWEVYSAVRSSEQPCFFVATPSVIGALDFYLQHAEEDIRQVVRTAWERLSTAWQIKPVLLDESQRKLAWILAYHLLQKQVVPRSHRWEAELLGEAAITADFLLVSEDTPLADLDARDLTLHCRPLGKRGLSLITNASSLAWLKS